MPDAQHIRQVYESYPKLVTARDIDAIVALYSEHGEIEDPIGSPIHSGRAAVRAFYEKALGGGVAMKQTGPVRIAGAEAAMPMVVLMGEGRDRKALDIISTMVFDDAGRVTRMRAFWSFDGMRDARPEE